jgi:hypothetical protein
MAITKVLWLVGVVAVMLSVTSGSMMPESSLHQPSASVVRNARCTKGDRRNLMSWWNSLSKMWAQDPRMRIEMTRQTLLILTQTYPELKDAFGRVDIGNPMGVNFTAHCWRISTAWGMLLNMLHNPQALDAALEHLADQHAARPGLKRQHFTTYAEMAVAMLRGMDNFDFLSGEACLTSLYHRIASKLED